MPPSKAADSIMRFLNTHIQELTLVWLVAETSIYGATSSLEEVTIQAGRLSLRGPFQV